MTEPSPLQMPPPDIGSVPWSVDSLRAAIPEFVTLYAERPFKDNLGGMAFNHCFAAWAILKVLQPPMIIESGVFKGQGTWLIEQASPNSQIICLDVTFERIQWRSKNATYIDRDFSRVDWSDHDLSEAVALFDDHQNAYRRMKEMHWVGLRRAIFEDNYPIGEGDAYSPRHILAGVGMTHVQQSKRYRRLKHALRNYRKMRFLEKSRVQPNNPSAAEP